MKSYHWLRYPYDTVTWSECVPSVATACRGTCGQRQRARPRQGKREATHDSLGTARRGRAREAGAAADLVDPTARDVEQVAGLHVALEHRRADVALPTHKPQFPAAA